MYKIILIIFFVINCTTIALGSVSSSSASASSSAQSSSTNDSSSASASAYSSAHSENKNSPKVVCGPDEQYSGCVNGGCFRRNCSQPGIICIDLIEGACKGGCRCNDNYLRAVNGTCIPEDQCPLICYGQNEVPGCEDKCPPQTCESIGKRYNCPFKPANPPCKPVCRCKPGFYRNKIGNCISKRDCLKCTGPHEYFSCGSECDNECYNLSKQNQTNCPYINIKCNDKCYCEDGYARNYRKICIPYAKCPSSNDFTKTIQTRVTKAPVIYESDSFNCLT